MSAMPARERAAALGVLGLPADATPEQITRAYRRLARVTHPDVTGATDPAAGDRFATISDAYQRLAAAPSRSAVRVHKRMRGRATAGPRWPVGWPAPPIVAGPVVITPLPSPRTSEGRR